MSCFKKLSLTPRDRIKDTKTSHSSSSHDSFLQPVLNEFFLFCMIAINISLYLLLTCKFFDGKEHFKFIFTILLLGYFQSLGAQCILIFLCCESILNYIHALIIFSSFLKEPLYLMLNYTSSTCLWKI
jgi:hypothetical protein